MKSKIKISKNKKSTTPKDKCIYSMTLVEEEKDKCSIFFPLLQISHSKPFLNGSLGFFEEPLGIIAVLIGNEINPNYIYIRPSKCICSNCFDCDMELVFEYDKKHTKEIKKIENAYFGRKIRIEAVKMTRLLVRVINILTSKQAELISIYKNKFSKK